MVRAFDLATGTQNWASMTGPIANAVTDDQRVYVNSALGDGQLRTLDLKTGKLLWAASGVGNASSPPTAVGDTVFLNSPVNGTVLAFDAATGAPRWSAGTGSVISSPVADTTRLFVGTSEGALLGLSQATGALLWGTSLGGEIYAGGTAEGLAFALSFSGVLHALDANTGAVEWAFDTGSGTMTSTVASADGRGFFASYGSTPTLYALDLDTGGLLWTLSAGFDKPLVADGLVFAQSGGKVIAIGTPYKPVPEPATLFLLASGIAGLRALMGRRTYKDTRPPDDVRRGGSCLLA